MTLPRPVIVYGILGALAALLLGGKRRKATKRVGAAVKVGLLTAAAAFVAPQLGVSLPGAPALPPGQRRS